MLLTDSLWKIKARERDVGKGRLMRNPDVIVLPEMWNTGYALDELDGLCRQGRFGLSRTLVSFC